MRVTIVGAGAVGALLGAMLARSGAAEVAFVARGATLERLRRVGIRVESPSGVLEVGPIQASADPAQLAPSDATFVAVKSWQVHEVAPRLAPLVSGGGVAVALVNGIEGADVLADALGSERVLGGLCHVLASARAPGEIDVRGEALRVTIGELAGPRTPRVDAIASALRAAGIAVSLPDEIRAAIWEKLLFVGPLGMVGAATRETVDRFRATPSSRALLVEAMEEIRRVALARGVRVSGEAAHAALARADSLPAGATTSMQRDLEAGRPSELDAQVGAIVRMAAAAGVDAPVHRVLHALLEAR